ncbi:MAG: aminoglycoside phosphotransferase family protein [Deltaproteobacteria bacterium]|nr:aminoglycoside phosphotransferase family protein [Deltaproteobacteria bacterium]
MNDGLGAVEADIRTAVEMAGLHARGLSLISPLGVGKGMRYAYRVETADGRVIKARHFESPGESRRVFELRRGIDDAFAAVFGCFGTVLLEEWIAGEMLDPHDTEGWAQTAGAIVGRLHARPLPSQISPDEGTRRWNESAAGDIEVLRHAKVLPEATCDALQIAVRCHDPGRARIALIHKDFCAENMLVDAAGRLRIIDTERITFEPVGFELGWTWHRWPMLPPAWERFVDGYGSTAPAAPEAEEYWRLICGLTLSRVFLQRVPARRDAQIARLLHCLHNAA